MLSLVHVHILFCLVIHIYTKCVCFQLQIITGEAEPGYASGLYDSTTAQRQRLSKGTYRQIFRESISISLISLSTTVAFT